MPRNYLATSSTPTLTIVTRRLNDSRDHESRLFYTDAVHSLRDSSMQMCTGERDVPHGRLREMLREFARLSPRENSPTSHLTLQQVFHELLEVQRLHGARHQGAHQRGPAAHDGLDELMVMSPCLLLVVNWYSKARRLWKRP